MHSITTGTITSGKSLMCEAKMVGISDVVNSFQYHFPKLFQKDCIENQALINITSLFKLEKTLNLGIILAK